MAEPRSIQDVYDDYLRTLAEYRTASARLILLDAYLDDYEQEFWDRNVEHMIEDRDGPARDREGGP